MAQFPPLMKSMPVLLHGGDYNPEQWIKQKDTIWPMDMKMARGRGHQYPVRRHFFLGYAGAPRRRISL